MLSATEMNRRVIVAIQVGLGDMSIWRCPFVCCLEVYLGKCISVSETCFFELGKGRHEEWERQEFIVSRIGCWLPVTIQAHRHLGNSGGLGSLTSIALHSGSPCSLSSKSQVTALLEHRTRKCKQKHCLSTTVGGGGDVRRAALRCNCQWQSRSWIQGWTPFLSRTVVLHQKQCLYLLCECSPACMPVLCVSALLNACLCSV